MKTASVIARILLGLMFLVFGLNGFLHFIPQPPPPPGLAQQFLTAVGQSHYFDAIFAFQLVGGALLLANRYVPLGLVLLGPIVVNILLYHALMAPAGIAPGIVAAVLWVTVFYPVRLVFQPIWANSVADLK
jgi:uncharacterized membrane protein YphA (DoxX/SURF4 family)